MTSAELPHEGAQQSDAQAQVKPKVPWPAIAVYAALAMGLDWAIALPLWLTTPGSPAFQLLAGFLPAAMMFTPLIATLVVVFIMKTPKGERMRFLGMWPMRPAKRVVWFIVLGMLAPIVLVLACLGISVAFGWLTLDLVSFSGMQALMPTELDDATMRIVIITQLAMVPLGGLINAVPAFGEELGWRGWLLPALRPLGVWPALLITGVIWGLWHAPLTLLGHNFNEPNMLGVLLMTVGCVLWGVFFGWLRLRSGSVWPAVVAHGALNASAGIVLIFGDASVPVNMALVNPLGISGWIVLAVVAIILLATGQLKKTPDLAAKREWHFEPVPVPPAQ